jgi:hypothetical protein
MSLADVLRVKKMADNINFLRLFFLKASPNTEQGVPRLEIIDCVLAIFFFELTRAFKTSSNGSSAIYSKDQFTFKILHFFSTLRLAKAVKQNVSEVDVLDPFGENKKHRQRGVIEEDSEEDLATDDEDSFELLDNLIQQMEQSVAHQDAKQLLRQHKSCANCKLELQENQNLKTLYKTLIENVITNL